MNASSNRTDVARLEVLDEQLGMAVSHDCWTVIDYML